MGKGISSNFVELRYLTGDVKFMNDAKRAEVAERTKRIIYSDIYSLHHF